MKKGMKQKGQIALKHYQKRFSLHCVDVEKHFRIHLLREINKIATNPKYDPEMLQRIQRQYQTDCLQHKIDKTSPILLTEESFAKQVDDLFDENDLFNPANRNNLLELYNSITSAYYTFEEINEKLNVKSFDAYMEYCRNIARKNVMLHQQLTRLTIDSDQITVRNPPPRDIPTELLRTKKIIDEQTHIGVEIQRNISSRCMFDDTRNKHKEEVLQIRNHISKIVNDQVPNSSTTFISNEHLRLERNLLLEKAQILDQYEYADITTVQRDLDELNTEYRELKSLRDSYLSKISKIKHNQVSLSKVGITKTEEYNDTKTKMGIFCEIANKNSHQLRKVLDENKSVQNKLEKNEEMRSTSRIMFIH